MSTVKISILSDNLRGTSFVLSNDTYVIGRGEEADIRIQDGTISNRHCTLTRLEEGAYSLRDDNSTNGTKVNGRKLDPALPPVVLNSGDIVQIGNVEVLIEKPGSRSSGGKSSVIDLDQTGTVAVSEESMRNIGAKRLSKTPQEIRVNRKTNAIFMVIIGVLCAAAAAAAVYMLMR